MSQPRKLRSCYLRRSKSNTKDIDMSIMVDSFIEELKDAKEKGLTDENGWLNLRICENAIPEGRGQYSHKLRIMA